MTGWKFYRARLHCYTRLWNSHQMWQCVSYECAEDYPETACGEVFEIIVLFPFISVYHPIVPNFCPCNWHCKFMAKGELLRSLVFTAGRCWTYGKTVKYFRFALVKFNCWLLCLMKMIRFSRYTSSLVYHFLEKWNLKWPVSCRCMGALCDHPVLSFGSLT